MPGPNPHIPPTSPTPDSPDTPTDPDDEPTTDREEPRQPRGIPLARIQLASEVVTTVDGRRVIGRASGPR